MWKIVLLISRTHLERAHTTIQVLSSLFPRRNLLCPCIHRAAPFLTCLFTDLGHRRERCCHAWDIFHLLPRLHIHSTCQDLILAQRESDPLALPLLSSLHVRYHGQGVPSSKFVVLLPRLIKLRRDDPAHAVQAQSIRCSLQSLSLWQTLKMRRTARQGVRSHLQT